MIKAKSVLAAFQLENKRADSLQADLVDRALPDSSALQPQPMSEQLPADVFIKSEDDLDKREEDPDTHVFLRVEFLSPTELKLVRYVLLAFTAASLAGAGTLLILKLKQPDTQTWFTRSVYEAVNLAAGIICGLGLLASLCVYGRSCYANRHKRWTQRRFRLSFMVLMQALVQLAITFIFSTANLYILAARCSWFDNTVFTMYFLRHSFMNLLYFCFLVAGHNTNQWLPSEYEAHAGTGWRSYTPRRLLAMWFGGWRNVVYRTGMDVVGDSKLVIDAPWIIHAPKTILLVAYEGFLLYSRISPNGHDYQLQRKIANASPEDALANGLPCQQRRYSCEKDNSAVLTVGSGLFTLAYFILYIFYISQGFREIWRNPYSKDRCMNLAVRLQLRSVLLAFLVIALTSVFTNLIKPDTCGAYITNYPGVLPQQILLTALAMVIMFYFMPKNPDEHNPILQEHLQDFAWTEDHMPQKRFNRDRYLMTSSHGSDHRAEPMFCLETALKALWWSHMAYHPPSVDKAEKAAKYKFEWDLARRLYGTDNVEELCSARVQAVLGWSSTHIVIAFRGTASREDLVTDLQVWRACHLPKRGNYFMGTQPLVHRGFWAAWKAEGFDHRLLARLQRLLQSSEVDRTRVTVTVTGHSLGGALATLAAYDIQKQLGLLGAKQGGEGAPSMRVQCYTFGAPRTGNHAFARDYAAVVPETWHVINDQDAVPRYGKFFVMYKRAGQRTIINYLGDILVRPSDLEVSLSILPTGGRPDHHPLRSYLRGMVSVCAGQFGGKHFNDGRAGVKALIENPDVLFVLNWTENWWEVGKVNADTLGSGPFNHAVNQTRKLGYVPAARRFKHTRDVRHKTKELLRGAGGTLAAMNPFDTRAADAIHMNELIEDVGDEVPDEALDDAAIIPRLESISQARVKRQATMDRRTEGPKVTKQSANGDLEEVVLR